MQTYFGITTEDCCHGGCQYFADAFGGDLSAWTLLVGSWITSGGRLSVSTANASIKCNTTHPTGSTKYRASSAMCGGEEGDQLRLWINNDPTTCGEVTFHTNGSTGRSRLRLFVAGVLVGETGVSAPPGEWVSLTLCTDGDHVGVIVGATLYLSAPATITSSVCGLATGTLDGSTPAQFDDFTLLKDWTDDTACPSCGESCTWFAENFGFSDPANQTPSLSPNSYDITGPWSVGQPYFGTHAWQAFPGARAIATAINGDGISHVASAYTLAPGSSMSWSDGERARVYADYVDANNHLVAVLAHLSLAWMRLELWRVASGVATKLGQSEGSTGFPYESVIVVSILVGPSSCCAFSRLCIVRALHTPSSSRIGIGRSAGGFGQSNYIYLRGSKTVEQNPYCTDFAFACPGGLTCSLASSTPRFLDMTIAGVASEATCDFSDPGGCVSFNATFRGDQDPANPCRYVYTAPGTPGACSPHHVVGTVYEHSGGYKTLKVEAFADAAETKKIWWEKVYGTDPIPLGTFVNEVLTFQEQNFCAGTPTCSVTGVM